MRGLGIRQTKQNNFIYSGVKQWMNTVDIISVADQVYRELQTPDDISIPNIVFFLQSNLPQLNVLIGTQYTLDVNEQVTPLLGESEGTILKYLYLVYYYNRLIKSNLGAGAYDFSEISEGDSHIRKVSRNEIAKTYIQLKNALEQRLDRLIFRYKQDQTVPQSLSAASDLIRFYRI